MKAQPGFYANCYCLERRTSCWHCPRPSPRHSIFGQEYHSNQGKDENYCWELNAHEFCGPCDAYVAARLRDADASLLGKATMSEWPNMRSSNYFEDYSTRGDQARSPYDLTVKSGGSSSGSAAPVAGNLCMFALGTETDDSDISYEFLKSLDSWSNSSIMPNHQSSWT